MRRKEQGGIFTIIIAILVFALLKEVLGLIAVLAAIAAVAFGIALIVSALKGGEQQTGTPVNTKVTGQGPVNTTSNVKVNYNQGAAQPAKATPVQQKPARAMTAEEITAVGDASKQLVSLKGQCGLIKDTEVRTMVIDICNQLSKILADLKMDPDDIHTARKVLSYYLPSMQDIVGKYLNLEASGTDMTEMKATISSNLPQIKEALGKQYEALFENDKLGLKVDMKAMNETFKREGLGSDSPFTAPAETVSAAEESPELKPVEMPM